MSNERIYIVGYMGSGKSSGGKRLAEMLGWPFEDTDHVLEKQSGKDISGLFEAVGEPEFRRMEGAVLRQLSEGPDRLVVATGGGTPCFGDHMSFMLSRGTVVYFKMAPEPITVRLRSRRAGRPLLEGVSEEGLLEYVRTHLSGREAHYDRAHITVDADALDEQRMKSVVRMIEARGINL